MKVEPWLPRAAAAHPRQVALETAAGRVTYDELARRAELAAYGLAASGVSSGDRVALALPAGVDFAVALHACLRLGAVAVPLHERLTARERAAQSAGAALVLEELPQADPIAPADLAGRHDPDAPAIVVHTSGTRGAPAPVALTYANWEASARGSAAALGHDPDERWLCALPLAHVGGLSILLRCAIHATTAVLHERFDTARVLHALRDERITLVSLVPTMLRRLLDSGLDHPPALRCALIGGAPLPLELARRAREVGVPLAQTYGLAEACSQVTVSAIGEPETAGRPLPGTSVQIGADGEILVAGATVATAALGADGLLHTADLGTLDESGRLTVVGRRSEMIVSGGENVAPAEVEAVLLEHRAVADAGVFGRPDAEWGERVVAAVVLRPGDNTAPPNLREHCAERLAGFKVPKEFVLLSELPRTASGKLLRRRLA
ncbi:MAG TPA: o-succinylbenzoate--CoA ligase [Solirubrobacteraceae bacterium]|nr:o-succinylbenzoate--CoA ligase [Solirubrobacteraceae bacterium]